MGGVKRKDAPSSNAEYVKKHKASKPNTEKVTKSSQAQSAEEDEDAFGGLTGAESDGGDVNDEGQGLRNKPTKQTATKSPAATNGSKNFTLDTSSAEAHAKQRALAKERKASKPNADAIQRSKKIWERIRLKSHVPKDERNQLVAELFDIITGRVRDFVFKHDSVRVVQCALKYANLEQRRGIVDELKGDVKEIAESRYGKFLIAKMVQGRDEVIRDAIIPAFYGHVRRMINHPEASWITDDIYREVATPQQKASMLREWYGAEFAIFHRKPDAKVSAIASHDDTADLSKILEQSPEKRKPILQYLLQMINSLIQKKMTGFTMLHDAMLQYFLALTTGSEEHTEFLEILKGDIDPNTEGGGGDLYRNLAFTKSGSRLVCLALAYGNAKDRKTILRVLKDAVEMMAYDQYGKIVLLVGLDVPDDTKMSTRSILFELIGSSIEDESQRLDRLEQIVTNLNARLPILYPMAGAAKWLLKEQDQAILEEVHKIRTTTSKKDPEARRQGILEHISTPALELVAKCAEKLVQSTTGCQFIAETLLEAHGEHRDEAKAAVAQLAVENPTTEGHIAKIPAAGRILKTLVTGGNFDPATKQVRLVEPRLGFAAALYPVIKDHIVEWACSDSSWVVVALLESEDVPADVQEEVRSSLKRSRDKIEAAEQADAANVVDGASKSGAKKKALAESKGVGGPKKIILEKLS